MRSQLPVTRADGRRRGSLAAVLDACVMVPIALNDTLLRLAERDLYRPLWSERILDEARRALLRVHADMDPGRIDARFRSMNAAFDDSCVMGWESLVDGLRLPDPDDRHVVAAALRGGAELIVTANLKDFPDDALDPLGLHALSPDEFLLDQFDLDPVGTMALIAEQAADQRRPPVTARQVLDSLAAAGVPAFAEQARAKLAK